MLDLDDNEVIFEKNLGDLTKSKISIVGKYNKVIFNGRVNVKGSLVINVIADSCTVVFGKDITINRDLQILILPAGSGCASYNNSVYIGNECFFNGSCSLILAENNNHIHIGESCLFAHNITINTSDSHPVFSIESGERLNDSASVKIGNHVWVGSSAHFLKGSGVGNNSVVGAHSVVTKFFGESNIAIGGNPARVVRKEIDWRQDARVKRI